MSMTRLNNEIAKHWKTTKPRFFGLPRRAICEVRPLKGRKGMTKKKYFQIIEHDDPRYKNAPYEESIIYTGKQFTVTNKPTQKQKC